MSSKKLREQVTEFHLAADIPILEYPQAPPEDRIRLRAKLIAEETFETLQGMYSDVGLIQHLKHFVQEVLAYAPVKVDLEEVADGCADLDYVVEGTRLEFGINGAPIAAEVHAANMRKVGPGSWHREDGKIMKPEGWTPPDIRSELQKQTPNS